jgi:hypothetical protein
MIYPLMIITVTTHLAAHEVHCCLALLLLISIHLNVHLSADSQCSSTSSSSSVSSSGNTIRSTVQLVACELPRMNHSEDYDEAGMVLSCAESSESKQFCERRGLSCCSCVAQLFVHLKDVTDVSLTHHLLCWARAGLLLTCPAG